MTKGKILLIVLVAAAAFIVLGGLYSYFDGIGPSKVRVIPIQGEISVYGNGASSQKIVEQIGAASSDFSTVAIILEINSPGGYVVASEEIARAVDASEKPVVAWIREQGASGAYWIASSADLIVAERAAITGSIGVTASYLQFAGLMDEYGVSYEKLTTGRFKDTGTPYEKLSPAGRTMMQSKLDRINEMFINHVAQARNMSVERVRSLATGEFFLGVEALENGLVDGLGGKPEALVAARVLSGVGDAVLVEENRGGSFLDELLSTHAYWFGKGFAGEILEVSKQNPSFTA